MNYRLSPVKSKLWEFFFLDAWFILCSQVNSQNNRCWCYENLMFMKFPLYDLKVQWIWAKLQGPCLFKKRILAIILSSPLPVQELKDNFWREIVSIWRWALSCVEKYYQQVQGLLRFCRSALLDFCEIGWVELQRKYGL